MNIWKIVQYNQSFFGNMRLSWGYNKSEFYNTSVNCQVKWLLSWKINQKRTISHVFLRISSCFEVSFIFHACLLVSFPKKKICSKCFTFQSSTQKVVMYLSQDDISISTEWIITKDWMKPSTSLQKLAWVPNSSPCFNIHPHLFKWPCLCMLLLT